MTEQKKETECWQWDGDPSGSDGYLMSEEAQRELLAETLTIIARNDLKRREAEMWRDFWRDAFFRILGAVACTIILSWSSWRMGTSHLRDRNGGSSVLSYRMDGKISVA